MHIKRKAAVTLLDFFETVYRLKRLRGRSPETSRLYRISIKHFSGTMGREATLADLTDDNLNRHCQRMRDFGKSPATVNKDISQITTIWRFAHRHNHVTNWPEVLFEIEPERVPMAWMPNEMNALLSHVDSMTTNIGMAPASIYWRAFISIAIDTGERVSAIRSCQWGWISDGWLMIPAMYRKGKTRDRAYRLNTTTIEHLEKMRPYCRGKSILPWPYCDQYFWKKYKKVVEGAGLPTDRRCGPHRLRRTHASAVHAAGHSAQEAMDHADARTTRAYIDPRLSSTFNAANILAAYLATPGTRDTPPTNEKKATG
jgi:integrase